jgi:putative ABC transport system permease protein
MKRVAGGTTLRNINVQVGDANQMNAAQKQIIDLLRQRHNIRPGRDDDFTVRSQQEIADAATATTNVMTGLLGAIAGVSLVVGGIGIMNIMLVSETERTREIGTRMAVGAHGRDILTQFLIEAISLSSVGGVLGLIIGIAAAKTIAITRHWPALISPGSIVIAFLVSAAVGIFFRFYPAKSRRARPDRSVALRVDSINQLYGGAHSFRKIGRGREKEHL